MTQIKVIKRKEYTTKPKTKQILHTKQNIQNYNKTLKKYIIIKIKKREKKTIKGKIMRKTQ